jgi:ABC-type glycerol-3-phosphate transport system substrate-binding protein
MKSMRGVSRRDFLRMAVSVAAGGILAACQPAAPAAPAAEPAAKEEEKPAEKPAAASEKLQIQWWSHTYKPWNDELTRQKEVYEEENPDVGITYTIYPGDELTTKFTTGLQAGTAGDILGAHSWMTPNLIGGDHIAEAPQWVVDDIKERFFPVCIDGATFKGKLYAYNQHIGGRGMIANVGLLEENNADLPASWEDMLALTEVIDKQEGGAFTQAVANYDYQGEGLFAGWGSILKSYGGAILADDLRTAAFNSDIGRAATELWTEFVHPEMGSSGEVFILGQTVIMEAGPWYKASIERDAPEMKFQPILVLEGPEAKIQCDYVWNWLVNSAASDSVKEASFKFTQWLNSAENQVSMYKASSLQPTTFEALEHPDIEGEAWAKTFLEGLEFKFQYVAKISNWLEVDKAMSDEFSLLATGEQSVADTLSKAETAVNKLLEEAEVFA